MSLNYPAGILIKTLKCYVVSAVVAFGILLTAALFINDVSAHFVGGTVLLLLFLKRFVRKWMPKERTSPDGKAVFISGCDRGFGYMLAQRLDDVGFHVFAGCLFPDGDGAANLRKSGSERLHVIALDVTSNTSVREAAAFVEKNLKDNVLWAIVNNAGVGFLGEVNWTSMDEIEKITDINLLGVVRVTKAFLAKLKESKGKILSVASLAGRTSPPGLVPYSMTKAAVISFCDGLRLELYKWGIQVISIEPSFYRTSMINEIEAAKAATEMWGRTSKEVKDMYNTNYIEIFIKTMLRFFGCTARDPSEVVSVMEEAIMDSYPEYSYQPGNCIVRCCVWVNERLPKPISDLLKLYTILGKDLM